MGFLIGIIVTAVGFILALAVHPANPGSVDVNTVGWILVVVGLVAVLADLLLWSSWGLVTCVAARTSTRDRATGRIRHAAGTRVAA